jgi:hypothetical protein
VRSGRRQYALRQWITAHGKFPCTAGGRDWRDACLCYGSAAFIFVEGTFGTIRRNAFAVYIGFGLQKGNQSQIATEILVAIGFFAAALGVSE